MYITRLKKKHRGQIRAVDFIVSLLLFLLMLSQLILIIFNVQSGIKSSNNIDSLTYEDLDLFGRSLLQLEGDPYWGYNQFLPNTFGLADRDSKIHFTVDASKISRIITGTAFPISSVTGFETFDYERLKDIIKLKSGLNFRLGFYPCINVNITTSHLNPTTNLISVIATNPYKIPFSEANVYFYTMNLTDGNIIYEGTSLTNDKGEANKTYLIPHINDPEGEHFTFIIVEKNSLWGINWNHYDPNPPSETVTIKTPSDMNLWACGINSSTLLISDILEETPETHFLSVIYKNTQNSFSHYTLDLKNQLKANETITIPEKGLIVFFSVSRINNVFQVGIGSFPSILDRDLTTGFYYSVFGLLEQESMSKSMLSKYYPIIVRGTLMRCQLILWSE